MAQQNTIHQYNLTLFSSYLKDLRAGTLAAFIAYFLIGFSIYAEDNKLSLCVWLVTILSIDLIKLLSFKFFKDSYNEREFSAFVKWHYLIVFALGCAWGSALFVLLPDHTLNSNGMLLITLLAVVVAYSATVMSASTTSMLIFVTPLLVGMLVYFALDFSHFSWWILATLLLGASSYMFSRINNKRILEQVESVLLNKRYIDEINQIKASVQKANIELVAKNEALITTQNRLEMLATNDELTQVANRRYAMTYLTKKFSDLKRHPEEFVVVLADIDHFKSINDRFGHPAGDEVLRGFSSLLKHQMRDMDTVSRYGGEEFLLILPKTKALAAKTLIQRLCKLVSEKSYMFDGQDIVVTASFGVSYYQMGDTVEKLIERADQALYLAKKSGRNTVKTYEDVEVANF